METYSQKEQRHAAMLKAIAKEETGPGDKKHAALLNKMSEQEKREAIKAASKRVQK